MMTELIEERTAEVIAARKDHSDLELSDNLLTRIIAAGLDEDQRLSKKELIDVVSLPFSFNGFTLMPRIAQSSHFCHNTKASR